MPPEVFKWLEDVPPPDLAEMLLESVQTQVGESNRPHLDIAEMLLQSTQT